MDHQPASRNTSATLDAIQLMLRDLHTRHDEIRHRAAFRGCTRELLSVWGTLPGFLPSVRVHTVRSHAQASTPRPAKAKDARAPRDSGRVP